MIKKCLYGNHGPKRTWCRHPRVAGSKPSRSVSNDACGSCELFVELSDSDGRPFRNKQSTECIHRSKQPVRQEPCKACGGKNILHDVYGCEVKGECVLTIRIAERVAESRGRATVSPCEICTERKTEQ